MKKKEVQEFIKEKILYESIDDVKKLSGVYIMNYDQTKGDAELMVIDSPYHFWKVKILNGIIKVKGL